MKSIEHKNLMYLLINIFSVIAGLIGVVRYILIEKYGYNENGHFNKSTRANVEFSLNASFLFNIYFTLLIVTITAFLLLWSSIIIIKDDNSVSNKLYYMIGTFCLIAMVSICIISFLKENRGLLFKKAFSASYICLFFSSISFFIVYSVYIGATSHLRHDSNEEKAIWSLSLISVCASLIGIIIILTKSTTEYGRVKSLYNKLFPAKTDGELEGVLTDRGSDGVLK
jgi:ABC-type multidrug transport system fused ATPase/permease subunit